MFPGVLPTLSILVEGSDLHTMLQESWAVLGRKHSRKNPERGLDHETFPSWIVFTFPSSCGASMPFGLKIPTSSAKEATVY